MGLFTKQSEIGLVLAPPDLERRSERLAAEKHEGCAARLRHCQRLAVYTVGDGVEPSEEAPAFRLHGLCEPCAVALGLVVVEKAGA